MTVQKPDMKHSYHEHVMVPHHTLTCTRPSSGSIALVIPKKGGFFKNTCMKGVRVKHSSDSHVLIRRDQLFHHCLIKELVSV